MEHIDDKMTRLEMYHRVINDIATALGYRMGDTFEPEALVKQVEQLVNKSAEPTEWLDEEGYPTEAALEKIASWPHTDGWTELLKFVHGLWAYADVGYWSMEKDVTIIDTPKYKVVVDVYDISTAGWSGNETIIGALRKNWMFWNFCWYSHKKGGHYVFHVKNEELSVNNTTLDKAG